MKVLYHIDDDSRWNMVLENVKNMLSYSQKNHVTVQMEVVANGLAVIGLTEHTAQKSNRWAMMNEFAKSGVVFAACNNSLNKFNLQPKDMSSFVKVVPAGVVEIAQEVSEGFVYIKP